MAPSQKSGRAARAREPLHDHLVISLCHRLVYWQVGRRDARSTGIKQDGSALETQVAMTGQGLRQRFEPVLRGLFHLYWRFARGMTLGVRGVVLDGDDKVFLVKHSYVSGWHLPGGGVEVGETFLDALRRELMEEGRIELRGEPVLHGIFLNRHVSRREHVAVYIVSHFRQVRLPEPNREIVACGFFDAGALPSEATEGTRRRMAE